MKKFVWHSNPFDQLKKFKLEMQDLGSLLGSDPVSLNLMTLSTSNKKDIVTSRSVMCRPGKDDVIHFYSNYNSRKSQDIDENPNVSTCTYWSAISTQVLMRGTCKRLPRDVTEDFYKKLPRISQTIPHVSKQSRVLESPDQYEKEMKQFIDENDGKELKCPSWWGGFEIAPNYIEFWKDFSKDVNNEVYIIKSIRVKYELDSENGAWNMHYLYS
jgi:pyridoxamine 5'-phosphate oxidase